MDVSFDDASTSQCVDDSSLSENELDSKVDEESSPSTREFKTGDCDFVANDDLSEDEFLIIMMHSKIITVAFNSALTFILLSEIGMTDT